MNRGRLAAAASACAVAALTACTTTYAPTPLPPAGTSTPQLPKRPSQSCRNGTTTHDPIAVAPLPPGSTMTKLVERGRLVVGVSADAVPLASRNALTGDIEGFEIDLARALAKALFGDESKLELRVIPLDDLERVLGDGDVDLAIRQVGATCERWESTLRLSAPYAVVPVRVLARSNALPEKSENLARLRVCAVRGSDAAAMLVSATTQITQEQTDTACMMRFQRGEVDAVAGTGPVVAGLSRQDPYSAVARFDLGTVALAVAVREDRADLVAWTNGVLQQRAGGAWAESWNRWVRPYAGDAQPPAAQYGRPR